MVAPIFRRDDLRMTNGNPSVFEIKSQGSGKMVRVNFCPSCALPVYGFKGGGKTLEKAGAVFASDLSGDKARILTMLALPTTKDQKKLQAYFDR